MDLKRGPSFAQKRTLSKKGSVHGIPSVVRYSTSNRRTSVTPSLKALQTFILREVEVVTFQLYTLIDYRSEPVK